MLEEVYYHDSELLLDYAVSEKIVEMIKHASTSVSMMGYKFVPDCDEGRDIFLALHQLGIRCMREQREVEINIAVDYREGLAKYAYRASDVHGLDWLASLQKYYPNLKINIAKVTHSGRNTLHAKAVVVDNLTMLKSGEGSIKNGRNGFQKEDGILLSGEKLANRVKAVINENMKNRLGFSDETIQELVLPPKAESNSVLQTSDTDNAIWESAERLRLNIYQLAHLNSKIFNPKKSDIYLENSKSIKPDAFYIYLEEPNTLDEKMVYRFQNNSTDEVIGYLTAQDLGKDIYQSIKQKVGLRSNLRMLTTKEGDSILSEISKKGHSIQYPSFAGLEKIATNCKQDIEILKKAGRTDLLQQIYGNHQDDLIAREQWMAMILDIEKDLKSKKQKISQVQFDQVSKDWKYGRSIPEICKALNANRWLSSAIKENDVGKVVTQAAVSYQKTLIKTIRSDLEEAIIPEKYVQSDANKTTKGTTPNPITNQLESSNEISAPIPKTKEETDPKISKLQSQLKSLNEFTETLPATADEIKQLAPLQKFSHCLRVNNELKELTIALNQVAQACIYPNESLELENLEKIYCLLETNGNTEEINDLHERIYHYNKASAANKARKLTQTSSEIKTAELLGQRESLQSEDEINIAVCDKKCKLLMQESSKDKREHSVYKSELLSQIGELQSNDEINIAVSNLNDPDIIQALAAACNKGVIVHIAIGKYFNDFSENLPFAGGSNSKAMSQLLKSVEQGKQKNLQVKWLVNLENSQKTIGSSTYWIGTHRKYLSIHKKGNEQQKRLAFIGSSPLDVQAQGYSAELDVLIEDSEKIQKFDEQLFAQEYASGIDMHFCLAIEGLKKAGFSHYAQWQYQRYINEIDWRGKSDKEDKKRMICKELLEFTNHHPELDTVKNHLNNLPSSIISESNNNQESNEIDACMTNLCLSLDKYTQAKRWPNNKYQSLVKRLIQETHVNGVTKDAIVAQVSDLFKKNQGWIPRYFNKNSFAFHLAKNNFFGDCFNQIDHKSTDKDATIIKKLNEDFVTSYRILKSAIPEKNDCSKSDSPQSTECSRPLN